MSQNIAELIPLVAATITGTVVIYTFLAKALKWFKTPDEIASIKEEQTLICYCQICILNCLERMNPEYEDIAEIRDIKKRFNKMLNQKAHK